MIKLKNSENFCKIAQFRKNHPFLKNLISDFWVDVLENFEMKFSIYGSQIKEIQPQIKEI